jgi:hypothetical protein
VTNDTVDYVVAQLWARASVYGLDSIRTDIATLCSAEWRKAFDAHLVAIGHPLASQAGTSEHRIFEYVREQLQRLGKWKRKGLDPRTKAKTGPRFKYRGSARNRGNPPDTSAGTVIYPRILAIHAQRREGSKTVYVHKFTSKNPVVGLPDGSILIPTTGRKLWGEA